MVLAGSVAVLAAGCSGPSQSGVEWYLGRFSPGTTTAQIVVAHSACQRYDHAHYSGDESETRVDIVYRVRPGPCTAELQVSELTLYLPRPTRRIDGGCDPRAAGSEGNVCLTLQSHWTGIPIPG